MTSKTQCVSERKMKKSDKDQKTSIEKWIDKRIQFALSGLTHPFEKRISRLRDRIQSMQQRVQRISDKIDTEEPPDEDARN